MSVDEVEVAEGVGDVPRQEDKDKSEEEAEDQEWRAPAIARKPRSPTKADIDERLVPTLR